MSATKKLPLAFAVVSPATVAFVTVNKSDVIVGADPPLQSDATVHSTEAVKVPVPSAMTGAKLVNPTSPPAGVFGPLVTLVIVEPGMLSLNRKSSPPPAPVSTNRFPLISETLKLTLALICVSVTVPNPGAGMTPPLHVEPEIWHDVRVKVSARAAPGAPSIKPAPAASAIANNNRLMDEPPDAPLTSPLPITEETTLSWQVLLKEYFLDASCWRLFLSSEIVAFETALKY